MGSRGWERLTPADAARLGRGRAATVAPSKYKNQRTVTPDGEKFDSKKEARIWLELKARQSAGEIRDLLRQQSWPLHAWCEVESIGVEVCRYVSDFEYTDRSTGRRIVSDAKGLRTAVYKLKRAWMHAEYGIEILEL